MTATLPQQLDLFIAILYHSSYLFELCWLLTCLCSTCRVYLVHQQVIMTFNNIIPPTSYPSPPPFVYTCSTWIASLHTCSTWIASLHTYSTWIASLHTCSTWIASLHTCSTWIASLHTCSTWIASLHTCSTWIASLHIFPLSLMPSPSTSPPYYSASTSPLSPPYQVSHHYTKPCTSPHQVHCVLMHTRSLNRPNNEQKNRFTISHT